MKLWTVQYVANKEGDSVVEWQPGKAAATNRAISLKCPVTVVEQELPGNREDMAEWLNANHVAPWVKSTP
jgi:hypothetical protein